jgi:hypothetical protein
LASHTTSKSSGIKGEPSSGELYWFAHEPCWFVRKKKAPWYGKAGENSTIWASPAPKFIMGSDEEKHDHPTQKPVEIDAAPHPEPLKTWRTGGLGESALPCGRLRYGVFRN